MTRVAPLLWIATAGVLAASPHPADAQQALAAAGVPLPASSKQASLDRGRYLVDHVALCLVCHSETDWKAPGLPQVAGTLGGGSVFPDKGVPGRVVSRNITPHAIGDCSDQQITRAIREGLACDGTTLFPAMPYHFFRAMSDDDVAAVVAYVRTLKPVARELPKNDIPPPVMASLPAPVPVKEPVVAPSRSDKAAYGRYLATIGLCAECHTPIDPQGAPLPGLAFAGGRILDGPWGRVASANLTPDASGIPYYDEALFRSVLRTCKVKARELNQIMPCGNYKGLTDEDVSALFAFLTSLPPVSHNVSNLDSPTPCARCGQPHGLGAHNDKAPSTP